MPKEVESPQEAKKKSRLPKVPVFVGVVILIALLVGLSGYLYLENQKSQSLLKNSPAANQVEVDSLVVKVGKHYELPKNDTVTVATVSDLNKLKGQVFFTNAQNGDKVLIYPKTSIAILYRPSTDKIINVGPVNAEKTEGPKTASTSATSQSIKVAIYNGTKTAGLARQAEEKLQALSLAKSEVVFKANSVNDYTDSVVVDLTGKNAEVVKQLAVFAKGGVGTLPEAEVKPDGADILIILGQSYVGSPQSTPTP